MKINVETVFLDIKATNPLTIFHKDPSGDLQTGLSGLNGGANIRINFK